MTVLGLTPKLWVIVLGLMPRLGVKLLNLTFSSSHVSHLQTTSLLVSFFLKLECHCCPWEPHKALHYHFEAFDHPYFPPFDWKFLTISTTWLISGLPSWFWLRHWYTKWATSNFGSKIFKSFLLWFRSGQAHLTKLHSRLDLLFSNALYQ